MRRESEKRPLLWLQVVAAPPPQLRRSAVPAARVSARRSLRARVPRPGRRPWNLWQRDYPLRRTIPAQRARCPQRSSLRSLRERRLHNRSVRKLRDIRGRRCEKLQTSGTHHSRGIRRIAASIMPPPFYGLRLFVKPRKRAVRGGSTTAETRGTRRILNRGNARSEAEHKRHEVLDEVPRLSGHLPAHLEPRACQLQTRTARFRGEVANIY